MIIILILLTSLCLTEIEGQAIKINRMKSTMSELKKVLNKISRIKLYLNQIKEILKKVQVQMKMTVRPITITTTTPYSSYTSRPVKDVNQYNKCIQKVHESRSYGKTYTDTVCRSLDDHKMYSCNQIMQNYCKFNKAAQLPYMYGQTYVTNDYTIIKMDYSYLLSNYKVGNITEAWKYCCSKGMYLGGFTSNIQATYLTRVASEIKITGIGYAEFWQGYFDENLDKVSYTSCTVDRRVLRRGFFLPGEPDNSQNDEVVLAIRFVGGSTGYFDTSPNSNFRALCQIENKEV